MPGGPHQGLRDRAGGGRAAGLGATIGLALSVAAKLALAFSMIGIFVLMRIWRGFG